MIVEIRSKNTKLGWIRGCFQNLGSKCWRHLIKKGALLKPLKGKYGILRSSFYQIYGIIVYTNPSKKAPQGKKRMRLDEE